MIRGLLFGWMETLLDSKSHFSPDGHQLDSNYRTKLSRRLHVKPPTDHLPARLYTDKPGKLTLMLDLYKVENSLLEK
jgi:hypothetical protein